MWDVAQRRLQNGTKFMDLGEYVNKKSSEAVDPESISNARFELEAILSNAQKVGLLICLFVCCSGRTLIQS